MPNIATALRDEIKRLSRQQSRTQIDPTRKATAVHRRDIALLKRQVVLLERQVKSLMRRAPSTSSAPQASVPGLKSALGRERTGTFNALHIGSDSVSSRFPETGRRLVARCDRFAASSSRNR